MEKRLLKSILVILTLVMIISTDFFVLGTNLISYAVNLDSATNNENIEFSVYFKDDNGERIDKITKSIKEENLKLYAEIEIKKEGYFSDGVIEIQDSNFNIKNEKLSDEITNIENNKIYLKQINAGSTVEIELNIEPKTLENINPDMLTKESAIKLTGTYMEETYKGLDIEATKKVTLNLNIDESAQAELETEIITSRIFSLNGTNKRLVQLLIKSRLTENQYPIKQTILNVAVPKLSEQLPEDVKVLSLGTIATNGSTDTNIQNWENNNGNIQITLSNNQNENGEVAWKKNAYDEIIVTLLYNENVNANKIELKTSSEILIYAYENIYTASQTVGIESKEFDNTIMSEIEFLTTEMYKGQLYANVQSSNAQDIQYTTKTTIKVTNNDVVDKINVKENPDIFVTDTNEIATNNKYISTEINREQFMSLLGESGSIQIKNGDNTYIVNKDTEVNENGNIIINYENVSSDLEITISNPINVGILEIQHKKAITEKGYTEKQIKEIKYLKSSNTISGLLGVKKITQKSTQQRLEIKETKTKAELTINKTNLSTMQKNENVILGIKLVTESLQYDLFKNPTIKIQLPSSVAEINVNSIDKLYGDEFAIKPEYNTKDKTINITLTGEQTSYPETQVTQLYLQINLDITLEKTTPSHEDKIVMTYTNENATQYEGGTTDAGIVEKNLRVSSPNGLVTINNTSTYNIEGILGISDDKQIVQVANTDKGKNVNFEIGLINNLGKKINNVRILGMLPTDGNRCIEDIENTLQTTLNSNIIAPNSTIYYSENAQATADITNPENGWTSELSGLTNPKVYLIIVPSIDIETYYNASFAIQLPNELKRDTISYTNYKVIYDTDEESNVEIKSTTIGFATATSIKMEANLSAEVGNDKLGNNDTIKSGEVIKYIATVKNNGTQSIENIQLHAMIPDGTVLVEPEEGYVYSGISYYEEKENIKEIVENIPSLGAGETYTKEYEVRVKKDISNGEEIVNKVEATCEDTKVESSELKNRLENANIRVTVKRVLDLSIGVYGGGDMDYLVFVENLSDESIQNLQLQMSYNNFTPQIILNEDASGITDIPEKLSISEIPANGKAHYRISGVIAEDAKEISATAVLTDSNGKTYRSNKIEEEVRYLDAEIHLTSPQDKQYIEQDDSVEYNITLHNTGNETSIISFEDTISDYLEVQALYVQGNIIMQTTDSTNTDTYTSNISNNVSYSIKLEPGAKAEIKILAQVKTITEEFDIKTITNQAKAKIIGVEKDVSEEVTHILKGYYIADIKNTISGVAWLDENKNGQKDNTEKLLEGIKVKIYDVLTNDYLKDENGNIKETTANDKGEYSFSNIKEGSYIVLFEYDMDKYEPTLYKANNVEESQNSDVVLKNININGEEKQFAVTDVLSLTENLLNVNIGLKEKVNYDMELDKYISRIVVQNKKGTKTYEYNDSTFAKVEIAPKEIEGTLVILEYTIKVKNTGEIPGYINNIVDYLPSGLTFSSELNANWYLSGKYLYTKSLENEKINPGEEREVKLILTKTMTENNTGLINNRAEIYETYNEYGNVDIDSVPNNQVNSEDDFGSVDVIIGIKTGGTIIIYIILTLINLGLIFIAIKMMIKNKIINIKRERR